MNNCGYFKIHKGKVSCAHPTYGEEYTKYGSRLRCDMCRRECNGIYPSQLPSADQTGWIYDIVTFGSVFMDGISTGKHSTMYIHKTWTEGDKVTL